MASDLKSSAIRAVSVLAAVLPWRNQPIAIEKRVCKQLRKLGGDAAKESRIGGALPQRPVQVQTEGDSEEESGLPLLLTGSCDNRTELSAGG